MHTALILCPATDRLEVARGESIYNDIYESVGSEKYVECDRRPNIEEDLYSNRVYE